MVQAHTYKVLLFGSGLMTPPLIDYLCKFGDTHITVASNIIEDARKLCERHPQHMSPLLVDVFDVSKVIRTNKKSLTITARSSRGSHTRKEPGHLVHSAALAPKGFAYCCQVWRQRHHIELHLASDDGVGR